MSFGLRKTAQGDMMADRAEQERLVRNSKLTWTLVKPPRLTDDAAGDYDAGPDVSVGMSSHLSRGALARFLLRETSERAHPTQAVFVRDR
jgi:hypothetical protein